MTFINMYIYKVVKQHFHKNLISMNHVRVIMDIIKKRKIQLNLSKTATLKQTKNLVFKTIYRFMQIKNIAECPKGNILR